MCSIDDVVGGIVVPHHKSANTMVDLPTFVVVIDVTSRVVKQHLVDQVMIAS